MKLPSGKEISNRAFSSIIDEWVNLATEYDDFSDAKQEVMGELTDIAWTPDDSPNSPSKPPYSEEDIKAIVDELQSTASEFYQELGQQFDILHAKIVKAKYPYEG